MGAMRLHIGDQADAALERARTIVVRERTALILPQFRYVLDHAERWRGESGWLCRLSAVTPDGQVVRGMTVTARTPTALSFESTYEWAFIACCPFWVDLSHGSARWRFTAQIV